MNGDCSNKEYLCYDGKRYQISSTLCGLREGGNFLFGTTLASCLKESNQIIDCMGSGAWIRGFSFIDNATVDTQCTAISEVDDVSCWQPQQSTAVVSNCAGSCSYHDCIILHHLGEAYDGNWEYEGCHNDEAYYCMNGDCSQDKYLCFDGEWQVSSTLCGLPSETNPFGTTMRHCRKTSNQIADCTGSGAWY